MLRTRSKVTLSILSAVMLLSLALSGAPNAAAQGGITRASRGAPAGLDELSLPQRVTASEKINNRLSQSAGRTAVVVRLSKAPAALATDQQLQGAAVSAEQDAVIARIRQIDGSATILGRVKILLNAVMVEIDAARLADLARDVRVVAINPAVDFELDLGETVPYIGATPAVQAAANSGAGVRVAVLDSGVDYTHAAFGGPGTAAAYEAAYGATTADPRNTARDGLFPTAKVLGGYDFVGEAWPDGDLAPDEDPIDFEGHGTHVADIIAGAKGVAPGASLYAVKVCSAVASSCSGVALIQGIEFAVDPNQDGKTDDAVDIINMSLGVSYGNSYFDDLSTAVENADTLGVLTVASAGNSGDRPYIVGTPSATPSALAVAQTQVPGAKTYPLVINSPAGIARSYNNTATVDWAPIGAGFSGDVVYIGSACPGDTLLADPAGKVALVDRGTCSVSLKTDVAATAGAIGVLVGLVAPGDPFSFGFGGGTAFVPTLVITQADASRIKANIAAPVNVTVSDTTAIAMIGGVVSSSSRGPAGGEAFPPTPLGYQFGQIIKPEIAAPGASVSAEVGTGAGATAFGGTSGAAPMVAGAAALVMADSPNLPPHEVKALLMNTAETQIFTNPATQPGVLAPITRIGTGEVRVNRALAAGAAAWEFAGSGASLSFGFVDVSRDKASIRRSVEVKNYTGRSITYEIGTTFRYADDQANGAVSIRPSRRTILVPPYGSRYFQVRIDIDGSKLNPWTMNSGAGGGSSAALDRLEYDGYITFTDRANANNNLHMAWHVLPRLSPQVRVSGVETERAVTTFKLRNRGVGPATYTPLSLIGQNPVAPTPTEQGSQDPNITARYLGAVTFSVPTSFCTSGLLIQFGVQTWRPVTHANYPVGLEIDLDIDRDGTVDALAFTNELNGLTSPFGDGRNVVYAGKVGGPVEAIFYTQHGTNSGAFLLTVCGEQVGLSSADAGRLVDVVALSYDNFFTGTVSATISGTMGVLNERYVATDASVTTVVSSLSLRADERVTHGMFDFGDTGTSETGLLLLNTTGGASEALLVRPKR